MHRLTVLPLVVLLASASAASAALINSPAPGTSLSPVTSTTSPSAGLLADSGAIAYSSVTPGFGGTIESKVYSDTDGLTFVYVLTSNASSTQDIHRLTVNGFSGFLTQVGEDSAAGTVVPASADRSTATQDGGDILGFNFSTANAVSPGTSTVLLVVRTNASAYTTNQAAIIDGTVAISSILAPAVPEPATLSALALGTLGLLARRRRA